MKKPTIRIHDIETNEVIDREMTDAEFTQYEADKAAKIEQDLKQATEEAAKAAILERLGITAEEAKLILA